MKDIPPSARGQWGWRGSNSLAQCCPLASDGLAALRRKSIPLGQPPLPFAPLAPLGKGWQPPAVRGVRSWKRIRNRQLGMERRWRPFLAHFVLLFFSGTLSIFMAAKEIHRWQVFISIHKVRVPDSSSTSGGGGCSSGPNSVRCVSRVPEAPPPPKATAVRCCPT